MENCNTIQASVSGADLSRGRESALLERSSRRSKVRRNQAACDVCRSRKVKCRFEHNATICSGCRFLKVPCTQNIPRRRRGPPNRYTTTSRGSHEQLAAASTRISSDGLLNASLSPSSVGTHPDLTPVLSSLGGESVVLSIIDEWFANVHPVAPILCRRQFLHQFQRGDAHRDHVFCGLVLSVCAATLATLRSRSSATHESLTVDRLYELCNENDLLPASSPFTVNWCLAKYNFASALMGTRGMDDALAMRVMGEVVVGVKYLIYYRLSALPKIEQEVLKRLYWLLFAAYCTSDMFCRPGIDVTSPDDNFALLRPLSLSDSQLDTASLYTSLSNNDDKVSYVPGLNNLSDLFMLWHNFQNWKRFSPPCSERILQTISAVRTLMDNLPVELRWRGGLSRPSNATFGHDVQIANLYITSLHIRSNLLQQLGRQELSQTFDCGEHQRIVDDLLEILYHMPKAVFEANGSSLVPKIRDIGAAFVVEVQGQEDGMLITGSAKKKLERLLKRLDTLDFRSITLQDRDDLTDAEPVFQDIHV